MRCLIMSRELTVVLLKQPSNLFTEATGIGCIKKSQKASTLAGLMWNTAELSGVLKEWVAIFVANRAQFSVININMP